MDESQTAFRGRHWLWLALCLLLFLALRLVWLGHLLVWDEAMELCTVRAFCAGGSDDFSNWFWRHPPVFSLLMALLSPFEPGFAERAELLAIGIGAVNLVLLFLLNRRIFGVGVAAWTAALLSMTPGSVFFDVWIKRDHPVVTFGLLAVWLVLSGRHLYAGVCLGLAMLCKETGIFYGMAALLLWAGGAGGRRRAHDVLALTVIPVLTCGWWYWGVAGRANAAIASGLGTLSASWQHVFGGAVEHARFALGAQAGWTAPWHFYLGRLPLDLGVVGILLAAAGVAGLWAGTIRAAHEGPRVPAWWPVLLLAPALGLLSCLPAKVAWTVIALFPAWATLQGIGMAALLALCRTPAARRLAAAGLLLAALLGVAGREYEQVLRQVDAGQWSGASDSRQIAEGLNRMAQDGDRVLLTSFYYWQNVASDQACPIFTYYLSRQVEVLLRPHRRSFPALRDDVERYHLDWALLSPAPGAAEQEVFGGFLRTLGLHPYRMRGAFLFRTASRHPDTEAPATPRE